jgi:hypothetical protein
MISPRVIQAEIPHLINYQGKVTDASGTPVADGAYTMRFRIYDASSGGTLQWDSGDRSITVSGGVFSVLLGESPQPALTLAFDEDLWLAVRFNGVDQSPRVRLTAVAYAYMASGLVPGTEVEGAVAGGSGLTVRNTDTGTNSHGVTGLTYALHGRGVEGFSEATSGQGSGVWGRSLSSGWRGVYGQVPNYV